MNKLFENKKVSDLITLLNSDVKEIQGMKGTHSVFHEALQKCIDKTLKEYGLLVTTWHVQYYENYTYYELISYNRDFTKDERTSSMNQKGKFTNIVFECKHNTDMSIAELITAVKRGIAAERVVKANEAVKDATDTLNKANEYLNEAQKNFAEFDN